MYEYHCSNRWYACCLHMRPRNVSRRCIEVLRVAGLMAVDEPTIMMPVVKPRNEPASVSWWGKLRGGQR